MSENLPENDLTKVMAEEIKLVIDNARNNAFYAVNNELLTAYWNVGRIIVKNEQNGNIKAEYGKQVLLQLSKELTKLLGKGFSRSNLQFMRKFYINYPICQTVSGKLSWSHYIELLSIENKSKCSFYEKEAENSKWSVRILKDQISKSLFERLLLSDRKLNKDKVLSLLNTVIIKKSPLTWCYR